MKKTDWDHVSRWYHHHVGTQGHYYHQHVVLPAILRALRLSPTDTLLDVACGNGVLSHHIPPAVRYVGLDGAGGLITQARKHRVAAHHEFFTQDVTTPFRIKQTDFSHAAMILALQNIQDPTLTFQEIARHLKIGGALVIVINHPYFRIPRQSSWQIDPSSKTQYRRIDRYLSPLEIPLQANPSDHRSRIIWTYHYPLQTYSQMLQQAGYVITAIDELTSDKQSTGKHAKMENRSREEFPLFMMISARKDRAIAPQTE